MSFTFDASQHAPKQTGAKHPPGNKFPFTITGTEIKDTRDKAGKYYEVTLTSPAGSIRNNYNLWNTSKTAAEIAVGQLSALCHATGIFKINFSDNLQEGPDGKELLNGKGMMDVGFQAGHEPSADKPEGGYVEVKKVYDANGNEPGKGPAPTASSGFTAQPAHNAAPAAASWGGAPANQAPPPNAAAPAGGGGWQPGNANPQKPPWG